MTSISSSYGRPLFGLLGGLTVAHFLVDASSGALPALLPHLRDALGLSYARLGSLVATAALVSALVQPPLGWLCDRWRQRWMVPAGTALVGVGMVLTVSTGRFFWTAAGVGLAALGVALYHPEGGRLAFALAGDRRATGMAVFSLGGNAGIALAPLLVDWLVRALGLGGVAWSLPAALAAGLMVAALLPAMTRAEAAAARRELAAGRADNPNRWGLLAILMAIVLMRSASMMGLASFYPFYYNGPGTTGTLLAVLMGGGAVTNLIAGPLADRFGRRAVMIISMAVLAAAQVGLLLTGAPALVYPLLFLCGFGVLGSFAVTLVMSQELVPRHMALASGLNVGMSSLGGVLASPLGMVADTWGLGATLGILVVFPLAGTVLAWRLPGR